MTIRLDAGHSVIGIKNSHSPIKASCGAILLGLSIFLATLSMMTSVHADSTKKTIAQKTTLTQIRVGTHKLEVEIADNDAQRQRGLMYRQTLPKNQGMLFIFPQQAYHCMWMKNTAIPLSVAFIDEKGKIINIAQMTPFSERTHCATRPARYALEVNQQWFATHAITAGALIHALPSQH